MCLVVQLSMKFGIENIIFNVWKDEIWKWDRYSWWDLIQLNEILIKIETKTSLFELWRKKNYLIVIIYSYILSLISNFIYIIFPKIYTINSHLLILYISLFLGNYFHLINFVFFISLKSYLIKLIFRMFRIFFFLCLDKRYGIFI